MNQKQLEKKVRYWQKILKLEHWDITCELCSPDDIKWASGNSYPQFKYLSSHLKIQHPKFYDIFKKGYRYVNGMHTKEIDRVIIHELVHCHTAELAGKRQGETEEERLVTYFEKIVYELHGEIYE